MPTVSVPKLRVRSPRAAEVRPSRLQAWLDELPQGNQEDSMEQILQALYVQNRTALEPVNRLSLMELYRDPVFNISESLAKHYITCPFPMTDRQFSMASSVQRLLEELANGYKIVANDLISRQATKKNKSEFAVSVQRATYTLSKIVNECCEIYRPYPAEAWRQLHQLYQLSEIEEILHHPIARMGADDGANTIFNSYERALLIGACNPYGLLQGECAQLFDLIPKWRGHVRISPWPAKFSKDRPGDFLVNLASDRPPIPLVKLEQSDIDASKISQYRLLGTLNVVRDVHSIMKSLSADAPKSLPGMLGVGGGTNADLLRRFGRVLAGVNIVRRSTRTNYDRDVPICVGMNTIHFFANGQRTFQVSGPDEEATRPPGLAANEEFFDLSDPAVGKLHDPELTAPEDAHDLTLYSNIHRLFTCSIKDQGASGVCVVIHGQNELYIRVGDLVGFQFPTPNQWSAGVVRWLRGHSAGALEFGVELLSPELFPVAVKRTIDGDKFFQALMLPGNRSLKQPQSLLVPRGAYKPGEKLILSREPGERLQVSPIQVLDRTGSFDQLLVALPRTAGSGSES